MPEDPIQHSIRVINPEIIDRNQPWAYFDGSAQPERCGGGLFCISMTLFFSKPKWVSGEEQITMQN